MSGGFLGRWSQRKLSQKQEEEARRQAGESPEEATETTVEAGCDTPSQENLQENSAAAQNAELLSEEELAALPPIESITRETDIRGFMRKGVPAALKTAALRKMWLADPAIRNHVDYAVDYAWDWNTPGGVPGNAGRMLGDSVEKMLDSILPKPVSDQNQPEPENRQAGDPEPGAEAAPDREQPAVQSAGDQGRTGDAAPETASAELAGNPETAHGNAGATEIETAPSSASTRRGDALSREDEASPVRPRRHGGAAPT